MEASGRHLSRRKARDWWTKGLLPRPCRHGLGRGIGTETFWTTPGVFQQARAAYDLLARHSRADITRLSLWLLGFPIDLRFIRAVYLKLINRHLRAVREQIGKHPDDIGGKFAEMFVRRQINKNVAPVDARHAYTDLLAEFLAIFYGSESELMSEGLAELWEKVAPYVDGAASPPDGIADLHPRDEDLATWARYLEQFVSLPAQREMIRTASNYELMRARRLVRFVLGYIRRIDSAVRCKNDLEEFGAGHLVGRMAVPILIAVLREDTLRHTIMSGLLDVLLRAPRPPEWPALMRAAGLPATLKGCSTAH